jgi:hypothetical protein
MDHSPRVATDGIGGGWVAPVVFEFGETCVSWPSLQLPGQLLRTLHWAPDTVLACF